MNRYARPRDLLLFLLISLPLIVIFKWYIMGGKTPFVDYTNLAKNPEKASYILDLDTSSKTSDFVSTADRKDLPEIIYLPQPEPIKNKHGKMAKTDVTTKEPVAAEKPKPKAKKIARKLPPMIRPPGAEGRVVIIIDDMGMGSSTSKLIPLPGPLTLSYLPYAKSLPAQTKLAKSAGHELMIHVPMQPSNVDLNPGPNVLKVGMGEEELKKKLNEALETFDHYVGINNHMGSKLTQDTQAMEWVMEVLKERGLLFVDSKTISSSVAADTAHAYNIPHAARDVFLDHNTDLQSVRNSLQQLERIAWEKGSAIAIGHPKPETIQALKEWLPTLKEKGLTLVPASAVVKRPPAFSLPEDRHAADINRLLSAQPARQLE